MQASLKPGLDRKDSSQTRILIISILTYIRKGISPSEVVTDSAQRFASYRKHFYQVYYAQPFKSAQRTASFRKRFYHNYCIMKPFINCKLQKVLFLSNKDFSKSTILKRNEVVCHIIWSIINF